MDLQELRRLIQSWPKDALGSPAQMFPRLLDLYTSARLDGTSIDRDGDMLLFQWGTYDWGQGEAFEIDLTRQAMLVPEGADPCDVDPEIVQLSCRFRFPPEPLRALPPGNRWCHLPADLARFATFVLNSDAMAAAARSVGTLSMTLGSAE